ncbi:MAG: MFS transporter [Schwartzia sp.]|nr:MFS transporter [Schwartzia sp. (in: firmicutes)]
MKTMNKSICYFALGHACVDWAQSAIPALLPYFIANYGLSYQEAASLVFANVLLSSVLQPIFGYYSDKVSLPWFIPLGPVFCGLSITMIGFASSYWTMFAAATICGLGSALFHPEAALLAGRIAKTRKGQAMSIFSVGGNAGFAIGPIVAGFCAYTLGIRSLALFGVVNAAAAIAIAREIPEAIRAALPASRPPETKDLPGRPKAAPRNDWPSFGRLSVAIFARSLGFTLSNTFIPIFWVSVLAATPRQGTMALSLLFALGALFTYCGGLVADRAGFVPVLRGAFLLMVPAMFFLVNSENVLSASLLLVPVAIALFLPYSPVVVLGQKYLGKNAGFASGVTLGLSTTIGGIFAPVAGWVADRWGLAAALQILWIAGIAGCAAAFTLKEPKG